MVRHEAYNKSMSAPARLTPVRLKSVERFFQFSLLGMLASGYFAAVSTGYLDFPTQALTLAALALHTAKACGWLRFELSNRLVAVLTLAYLGFYPLDYEYFSGSFPSATVHLVFFLASIKLLTAATDRDYAHLKIMAALGLIAAAVFSFSPSFFAFLAVFLLFTVASLASGEVRRSAAGKADGKKAAPSYSGLRSFGRRLGATSFVLFAGILILTAGLFFVLPRTARAAMSGFFGGRYHLPGFTNEIRLGEIGEIKQSGRAVMHIRSDSGESLANLRWRGAELTRFDGHRWESLAENEEYLTVDRGQLILGRAPSYRLGHEIAYQVQLEEVAADTLFFAGTPETISINLPKVRLSRGSGAFHVPRMQNGIVYRAYSFLPDESAPVVAPPPALDIVVRRAALELPPLDPRIPELAQTLTAEARTDEEIARTLERRLRHDYGYTLELLKSPVADPLAHFLFVRKKGHCEYFASAMAVMLRTLGIPSRVVAGFQSGVFNPMTASQVVRASDAHSWVEAWIAGKGWTTFDPTPADPRASAPGIAGRISFLLDAASEFWQDWVLSYDLERQAALASRMQESSRKLRFPWLPDAGEWWPANTVSVWGVVGALVILVGLAMVVVLFGPTWARWWRERQRVQRARRGEGQASDATLLYQRMLAMLARRGFQKPPWLTPAEFARVLPASEVAVVVEELTSAYNAFRFGGERAAAPRMVQLLERLETLPR
jgi:protein-glutamine gamma-glutamyltransferase